MTTATTEGYPRPCEYPSFEDDPYTMGMTMCDPDGMKRGPHLETLNRLRQLSGHEPYTGEPFTCTGHAHLAGEHIECLSSAHARTDNGT